MKQLASVTYALQHDVATSERGITTKRNITTVSKELPVVTTGARRPATTSRDGHRAIATEPGSVPAFLFTPP